MNCIFLNVFSIEFVDCVVFFKRRQRNLQKNINYAEVPAMYNFSTAEGSITHTFPVSCDAYMWMYCTHLPVTCWLHTPTSCWYQSFQSVKEHNRERKKNQMMSSTTLTNVHLEVTGLYYEMCTVTVVTSKCNAATRDPEEWLLAGLSGWMS